MEVVTQHLDHRRSRGFAVEGMTCAQLVEAFAPPIDRDYVVVLINGHEVRRACWAFVTPKERAVVVVAITPGKGGGGKKNPIALIASIAIAIIAPGIGAAIANAAFAGVGGAGLVLGFGVTAGQAFGLAVGFVANMALGAIFKPSTPKISAANPSSNAAVASSPTYSIAGQSNLVDPYGPVRRIFGLHRVYPVVVGQPYVEVYGDDQYLTTLYDVGAGDYEVSDVRIGASHISYFQNATYALHRNTKTPNLMWYWGARHADQYNLILGPDWSMVDTLTDTGYFVLAFAFPTGIASISAETGATTPNVVRFQIEFSDFGVGNWKPLEQAYWWSASRQINPNSGTLAEITGGEILRDDVGTWGNPDGDGGSDGRAGPVRTRTVTTGYAAGVSVLTMRAQQFSMFTGARFTYNGTTYTLLSNCTTVAGPVTISPPLQTEIVTQIQTITPDSDGLVRETADQYLQPPTVELFDTAGGNYLITDARIQQLALSVTVRPTLEVPGGRRYSIRARQSVGAGDERLTYGDMMLVGVSSISATQPAISLRNEHTLLELRVKANDQVSGVLEELSCFAQANLLVVRGGVGNYELTRNPAWALFEVLTGKMNKRPVAFSKIDLASFEAWAAYCDSIHPATGAPRAQFDHIVDYNTTIFSLAQTITAAGRATLAPGDGLLRVLIDQPQATPVQVFTPHNSKGFSGARTFIEAPHAFRAKFMNRETWKVEEVTVYNDGYSVANATVFEQIEFPGVTRSGQVWCDGRYRMAQGIHRQETWTLEVDVENLICTRGDLVHVAHDVPSLGGVPSRIKEVHLTPEGFADYWVLTEPVDFGGDPNAYGWTIRSVNGIIQQGMFAGQGDAYTVYPAGPLPGNVLVGDLHVWGRMDHVVYPFIVAAINPQADLAATLTLVPYAGAAIFGADTGVIPPYDPVVDDDLSSIAPPPISRVTVLQTLVYADRRPVLSVSFDWREHVAPTFVQYEVWLDWEINWTGAPALLARTTAPHFEWLANVDIGVNRHYVGTRFCVRVLGVNVFGVKRTLAETPMTCDFIIGDTTKPAAPPSFELDLKRDTITLAWEHPAEPDVDFYEIRYAPEIQNATYAQSTLLAPQVAYPTRSMDVPARLGTYFIKCVDTSGNRSDEYASAFTPGENIWQLNVVALWDDQPDGWPGSKDGFAVHGGRLETVAIAPGVYPRRAEYFYADLYEGGAIYQTRFTSKLTAAAVVPNSYMATWTPLASADPIEGSIILDNGASSSIAELVDAWHEIRWVTAENVMADWTPLASAVPIGLGDANFGAWRRFQVGDYIGEKFQFRVVAQYIGPDAVPDVGVVIGGAQIEIDMTDRMDGRYDQLCPAGGLRVAYQPAFKERPAISITPDNMVVGDTYRVLNSDRNGFDLQFFNAGVGVARQFDWLAKGYGAKSAVMIDAAVRKGTRRQAARVTTRTA